jgi:probable HAF family extracellular repeat protein
MQMRIFRATSVVTLLGAAITGIAAISTPAATSFSFTTIDAPHATATYAFGINHAGQIVGFFRDADKGHGFLRRAAGDFTTIDVPSATVTIATKINGVGQIVGTFMDARGKFHGFVRAPTGTFNTIDIAGALATFALGINDAGQIVGAFTKPDSAFATPDSGVQAFLPRGFVRGANGAVTPFSLPGATNTTAINGRGQIVGTFADAYGKFHGFLRAPTGSVTSIDVPVAGATGTHAFDISDSGQIVGFFGEVVKSRGFVRSAEGVVTAIDAPGAIQTHALGIDDSGHTVGVFEDVHGTYHGFVATR